MKKSVKIAVVALCAAFAALSAGALAACNDDNTGTRETAGIRYELTESGDSYIVKGSAEKAETTVEIPEVYHELPVTAIDNSVFQDCKNLTSVTMPDTITAIGDRAFNGCEALGSITLPAQLTELGQNVFENCTSLEEVKIPASLENIGANAFSGCVQLASVDFGEQSSLSTIDSSAFKGCVKLQSITLPSTDAADGLSIGPSAFKGCSLLAEATFSDDVVSIGGDAFEGCKISSLTFGADSKLDSIGEYAFQHCKSLAAITLPASLSSVGWNAFYDTAYYDAPASWTGDSLKIDGCLVSVKPQAEGEYTLPEGVSVIAASAFYNCGKLTSAVLGEGLKNIGIHAFLYCGELLKISLPQSLVSIGDYAFKDCNKLVEIKNESALDIKASSDEVFGGIGKNAKNIYKGGAGESRIFADGDCTVYDDGEKAILLSCSASGELIRLPEMLHGKSNYEIFDHAFSSHADLKRVVLPTAVTGIGSSSFPSGIKAYYKGDKDGWTKITGRLSLSNVYYFSAGAPEGKDKYWHDDGGEIVEWQTA